MSTEAFCGAICYDKATPLESLLAAVREGLARRPDLRLAGLVPRLGERHSNGRQSMLLDDIVRGDAVCISQDLGPGSRGCILDADGLAQARMRLSEAIALRPDLLIVGRFAKEEVEGRGIRPEIAEAIVAGIPCLVAVSEGNLAAWMAFAGDEVTRQLPAVAAAIVAWVETICQRSPARQTEDTDPA
jgi:molybdate transport system ATP-binding protein